MAIEFKGIEVTRGSEYLLYPEAITIKADLNGRHDAPDITALKEDILRRGQLQPVVFRKEGDVPVLVAGFSRWRAISEINAQGLAPVKMKIRCVPFKGNEKDAFLANIAENKVRNQTTPLDDAHNIAKLERWGLTHDDIAAAYHEKKSWVAGRLELLSLGEEARAALQDGSLKPAAAHVISKLDEKNQKAAMEKAGKGASAKRVKEAVAQVTGDAKPKRLDWAGTREVLRAVFEDGVLPEAFTTQKKWSVIEQDAIDAFCQYLLKEIKG